MTSANKAPDQRRNAYRPDLADIRLEGKVDAERFVAGASKQIRHASTPMRRLPDPALGLDNEVLLGERVSVFDEKEGWAWVQLERDGYVGYITAAALADTEEIPTHRVSAPATFVYPSASIKTPPLAQLSLNAVLRVTNLTDDGRFAQLASGGFVYARHICDTDRWARDFVDIAEQFIHTPYLWGGRTRAGIDCSGLVQLSLQAAGIACPRDSDMIAGELGAQIPVPGDLEGLQRGDVVCWPGHCGIMIDGVMVLHANAHHMATAIEPLSHVARRISNASYDTGTGPVDIRAIRRLPALGHKPV